MSNKGKLKLPGSPPGLAVPRSPGRSPMRSPVKLSPRAKWKRALQKMDGEHRHDVPDVESVPLTERESLSRQNSAISGRRSVQPSASQIPNVVQYDARDAGAGDGTRGADTDAEHGRTGDNNTTKQSHDSDKLVVHGDTNNKINPDGSVSVINETAHTKLNGSINSKDGKTPPLSRLGNDVPLNQSLTVPGKATSSSTTAAKDGGDGKERKTSLLMLGRETSKLSVESRKSLDARMHQYTAVGMPAEEKGKPASVFSPEDSFIKTVIPYMPLSMAVTCLVMNVLLPGSGTILSGASVFCCGKSRVPAKFDQDTITVMCVNTCVGVAQLFTVTFMLVGWFWSLAWGITMIILSLEHRRELKAQREVELKKRALEAFGTSLPGGRIAGFM